MEWRPIETAPKDGTHILVFAWKPNRGMVVTETYWHQPANLKFKGHWVGCPEQSRPRRAEFWTSLPNPPTILTSKE